MATLTRLKATFERTLLVCCALIFSLTLSGCGFHLKQTVAFNNNFDSVSLSANNERSALYRLLKKQLTNSSLRIEQSGTHADVELELVDDNLSRRNLSLFANGQVAEYELIYHVTYWVKLKQQDSETVSFELYRNYQDDPDNALAKSKEMDMILDELRHQASQRILREIATR